MEAHALGAAQYLLEVGGTFRSPRDVPPRMTILAGTAMGRLMPLLVFGFVTNAVASAPPSCHKSVVRIVGAAAPLPQKQGTAYNLILLSLKTKPSEPASG